MIRRPLLPVALLFIAGVLLADFVEFPLLRLFALAAAVTLFAFAWKRRRVTLLAALVFLAGAADHTFHTAVISPDDLRALAGSQPAIVTVRGKLLETPRNRIFDPEGEVTRRMMSRVEVTAISIRGQGWRPALGRIAVTTPGSWPGEYFAGKDFEITGVLRPPRPPEADGLFDYRYFLRRSGIYFELQTDRSDDWKPMEASTGKPPVSDRFLAWGKNILGLGLPDDDKNLRLLWAMTLGWKSALHDEVAEPFIRAGTLHIFAVDGLRIALITGIIMAVMVVFRAPRAVSGLVMLAAIWFYAGVTGWQVSAIRATVMMTVIIGGWALRRPGDLLNSLAAAALVILVWQPQQLFQSGFQLSFFVVLALALVMPSLEKLRQHWLQPDPLLPEKSRPLWRRIFFAVTFWSSAWLATSIAAWLGSIPLTAYYFHVFSPAGVPANFIAVPLGALALAANMASLLVGGFFPWLAEIFNNSAWFWMDLMERVSRWSAALPGGFIYVRTPTALAVGTYYLWLLAFTAGWLRPSRWRGWLFGVLLLASGFSVMQWVQRETATRLTVLPLSGGCAVYYDAPTRSDDVLIDCGDESAAEFVVKPFLRAQGVNRLSRLALTHGDVRNMGGADVIATNFSVGKIVTSPLDFRSPTYRSVLKELEQTPERWQRVNRHDYFSDWLVLHPSSMDKFSVADDGALVSSSSIGGLRVLLLSDLGRKGQGALLARGHNLRADIVVAGLPAKDEPLGEELLEAMQPRLVIVVDSEFPATRRAGAKLRERLSLKHFPVIYTREHGALTMTFRAGDCEIRAADGAEWSLQQENY